MTVVIVIAPTPQSFPRGQQSSTAEPDYYETLVVKYGVLCPQHPYHQCSRDNGSERHLIIVILVSNIINEFTIMNIYNTR